MPSDSKYLDLTLSSIPVGGRETPHDLKRFLYKGGASCRVDQVELALREHMLGEIQMERVELTRLIHEFINGNLVAGGSAETARTKLEQLTYFFIWADNADAQLGLAAVIGSYLRWTEHLLHRVNILKDLKLRTACHQARLVGQILDGVLERSSPIFSTSRLKAPVMRRNMQGSLAEKQNLHDTFAMGYLLQDICDGTSLEVIWRDLYVKIPTRQGDAIEVNGRHARPRSERQAGNVVRGQNAAAAYQRSRSLEHRFRRDLVNMRLQAELLMFIGQTGMNLTQAQNLKMHRFSYSSDIEGYKVREYKARRNGEVLFEIFSEYRAHFERYLEWRKALFPAPENRLFPFIRSEGIREDLRIKYGSIQAACKKAGVTWVAPSLLRGTRVNWLLRRSGNPSLAAEMAQHHQRTLLNVYEKPSLQRAVSEIIRFHLRSDPALSTNALFSSILPGNCHGSPTASPEKPNSIPEPDCTTPSGCLWCESHRDIDSFDYVWSLACFRHIKILELSKQRRTMGTGEGLHPAEHVATRLGAKLSWFKQSNEKRREWVEEALIRIEEGDYHDQWSYLIESVENRIL